MTAPVQQVQVSVPTWSTYLSCPLPSVAPVVKRVESVLNDAELAGREVDGLGLGVLDPGLAKGLVLALLLAAKNQ